MRICLLNENELYFYDILNLPSNTMINERNEFLMFITLKKFLLQKLSKFTTTVDEDKQLLNNMNLSNEKKNCIIYRLGQKEILLESLKYLSVLQNSFFHKYLEKIHLNSLSLFKNLDINNDLNVIKLETWFENNNILFQKIKCSKLQNIENNQNFYGFLTLVNLPQGEEIISIPKSLLINSLTIQTFDVWKPLIIEQKWEEKLILILFLIQEKHNSHSFWKIFLNSLPNLHSPLLFSEKDLNELEGTQLFEDIIDILQQYQQDFLFFFHKCSKIDFIDKKLIKWKNYIWARTLLEDRAISLVIN